MNPRATHLADQRAAAVRHATTTITSAANALGVPAGPADDNPWLQDQYAALRATIKAGRGYLCPHIGPTPMLVMAAAWAPGRIACPLCATTALFTLTPTEDFTCDRCGQQDPQLERGACSFGPILFHFGLCSICIEATSIRPVPVDPTITAGQRA